MSLSQTEKLLTRVIPAAATARGSRCTRQPLPGEFGAGFDQIPSCFTGERAGGAWEREVVDWRVERLVPRGVRQVLGWGLGCWGCGLAHGQLCSGAEIPLGGRGLGLSAQGCRVKRLVPRGATQDLGCWGSALCGCDLEQCNSVQGPGIPFGKGIRIVRTRL